MITASQLARLLLDRGELVCRMLLPGGKRVGEEWEAGDITGVPGGSLKVRLYGEGAGRWIDFATNDKGGDLLDLWAVCHGLSIRDAIKEVKEYLNIHNEPEGQPRKRYALPDKPKGYRWADAIDPIKQYLNSRGITDESVKKFKLIANNDEIGFPYLRDGVLLNVKYLKLDRPNGKKQCRQERNAEPCLFGWHTVSGKSRSVVIVEGEIDAITVNQWGFDALSVPNGASSGHGQDWIESDYDHLLVFDTIYLCTDMDEPGRRVAKEISIRLGQDRCRVVSLPHKDANECLQKGLTADGFKSLLDSSKTVDPEELRSVDYFIDDVKREFYPDEVTPKGLDTPWPKVGNLFRFRPGEVTLWSGFNGHGKSLLLNNIVGYGAARNERFCVASMEMTPRKNLYRLIRQITCQKLPESDQIDLIITWLSDKLWLFDVIGEVKIETLLRVFEYAARRYNIRQFVIDSLAKCGMDEDDYNGQKRLVDKLTSFAHRYMAHVHLVAHPRKAIDESKPPGKMDVRGGGVLTDLVDNVVVVWRNKRHPDDRIPGECDAKLVVLKQREPDGYEGEIFLWFHAESLRYVGHLDERPERYFLLPCNKTA